MNKRCGKCKTEKPLSEFNKNAPSIKAAEIIAIKEDSATSILSLPNIAG